MIDSLVSFIIGSITICLAIAIPIMVCVYVYRDATQRGMNAAIWVLVVLMGQILGIIIYLIVRREHPGYMSEPNYKDRSTGKVIFASIFIPILLISIVVFNFGPVGTASALSASDRFSVEDYAGHQKIMAWIDECDDDPSKTYALRYRTEEFGRKKTHYLIYTPSSGVASSTDIRHANGLFARNLDVRIREFDTEDKYKLQSISYTASDIFPGLKISINGKKIDCDITDVDYSPTHNPYGGI